MGRERGLLYVTNDYWWDTDITILPSISKQYPLTVYCVSPKNPNERKYKDKSLPGNVVLHDCRFGRSKKDIRMLLSSFVFGIRVLFASIRRTVIWVPDDNIWCTPLLTAFAPAGRCIISVHNYTHHSDAKAWQQRMMSAIYKRFVYFHFHSPLQEMVFKTDHPDKKSFSTNMPVKDFGKASGRLELFDNEKRTYLFFGGIRSYKRPDLFIRVSNKLKDKANFVIAGNGDDLQTLESLVAPGNPIKCLFRYIENEEIADLFTDADFLVLPYEDSSQSGPLLTAFNYCLPVIATSLPYFESMIENRVTGFLCDAGSADSLESVIEESISMSDDDYGKMKAAMEKRVKIYKRTTDFSQEFSSFLISIKQ